MDGRAKIDLERQGEEYQRPREPASARRQWPSLLRPQQPLVAVKVVLQRLSKAELRFHRSSHTKWALHRHTHTCTPATGQMKSVQGPGVTFRTGKVYPIICSKEASGRFTALRIVKGLLRVTNLFVPIYSRAQRTPPVFNHMSTPSIAPGIFTNPFTRRRARPGLCSCSVAPELWAWEW